MDPIIQIHNDCINNNKDLLDSRLKSLGIVISKDDRILNGKQLFKVIMNKWLPLTTCITNVTVNSLPSPVKAQQYRCEKIYPGNYF